MRRLTGIAVLIVAAATAGGAQAPAEFVGTLQAEAVPGRMAVSESKPCPRRV
jgi:hypothetical protein